MASADTTLVEHVLDVAKRARKPDVHQHAKLDDPGRDVEVPERVVAHCFKAYRPARPSHDRWR
ncbi:MAG: hypothetical protein Q8L84_13165 [Hyphomonas sp.]|nr:hypothetical protein [Hyphomonas sp.]